MPWASKRRTSSFLKRICIKTAALFLPTSQLARRRAKQADDPNVAQEAEPKSGLRNPPRSQRGCVGGVGRDLFHREERLDPVGIQRIQHQKTYPEIGHSLKEGKLRSKERDQVKSEKQKKPRG